MSCLLSHERHLRHALALSVYYTERVDDLLISVRTTDGLVGDYVYLLELAKEFHVGWIS